MKFTHTLNYWFMVSVRLSSYECSREVATHKKSVRVAGGVNIWPQSSYNAIRLFRISLLSIAFAGLQHS